MRHLSKLSLALLGLALGMAIIARAACRCRCHEPAGETKAHASDCFACHAVDHKLVGPSYQAVAERYAGKGDDTVATLVKKIKKGGYGNWGEVPMTAHPSLSDADITEMVHWILSLHRAGQGGAGSRHDAGQPAGKAQMHTYKNAEGKSVQVDFAAFTGPDQKEVSQPCSTVTSNTTRTASAATVAMPSAANTRRICASRWADGMTYEQFLSTAMAGRQDKGMPSWAGLLRAEATSARSTTTSSCASSI